MAKIIKLVIGVLASLFAAVHVYSLIGKLINSSGAAGEFAISTYMGHVVGVAVGLLIAVLCFRSKKTAKAD
jgi:hypothetical protein